MNYSGPMGHGSWNKSQVVRSWASKPQWRPAKFGARSRHGDVKYVLRGGESNTPSYTSEITVICSVHTGTNLLATVWRVNQSDMLGTKKLSDDMSSDRSLCQICRRHIKICRHEHVDPCNLTSALLPLSTNYCTSRRMGVRSVIPIQGAPI